MAPVQNRPAAHVQQMPAMGPQKFETKGFNLAELDPKLHEALKMSPAVQRLGLSPEVAAQWASMGRKGGEDLHQAIARFSQETGRSLRGETGAASGALAGGSTSATVAPKRMNQTAATVV